MARRRTAAEIEQLLEQYRASGMTQAAHCQHAGIPLSTLGRYLRQHAGRNQRLIRVEVESQREQDRGFVLVLANGRRIETGWSFAESELARWIAMSCPCGCRELLFMSLLDGSPRWTVEVHKNGTLSRCPLYLAHDLLQEPLLFKEGFYQMVPNQSAGWSGAQARMNRADDP